MSLRIATALTQASHESSVVSLIVAEIPDAQIVHRCRDVVELRAIAHAAQVDVAVVDADLRGLDRDVVDALTCSGVHVVAVGGLRNELLAMGVAGVVEMDLAGLAELILRSPEGSLREPLPSPSFPTQGSISPRRYVPQLGEASTPLPLRASRCLCPRGPGCWSGSLCPNDGVS